MSHILSQGPTVVRIDEADVPYVMFTSDLHLRHKGILYYTDRLKWDGVSDVESMEDRIADGINAAVTSSDNPEKVITFNCGDFVFASASNSYRYYNEFRRKLIPTRWYNVIGNHDENNLLKNAFIVPYEDDWVWNAMYIVEICRGNKKVFTFTVSHFPMDEFFGYFNVHGHLHTPEDLSTYKTRDADKAIRLREGGMHVDVGVDRWCGKPVWLTDILEGKTDVAPASVPQISSANLKYNTIRY